MLRRSRCIQIFLQNTSSNNKDTSNTIIETSTAEYHDVENLHNPETVQDAVIHLEVDEKTANYYAN